MKKSVRIRKALPGETPRFINKTSKFLTKAAMGMSVSAPSNEEMISNIVESIYTDLSYDADPDVVLSEIISKYKISENSALMLLKIAMTRLSDEGFYDKEDVKSDAEKTQDKEKALAIANQKNKELQDQQTESDNLELDEMNNSEKGYDAEEEDERLNDRSYLEDEESMQQEAFNAGGEISEQQRIINQYAYPGKKSNKIFSLDEEIKNTPGTTPLSAGIYPELTDYIANYRPISDSYQYSNYLPEGKEGMEIEAFDPACPCPPTCDCRNYGLAIKEGIPLLTKFFPETGAALNNALQGFDFINKETPIGSSTGVGRVLPIGSATGQAIRSIPKVGKWFDPKVPQTYVVQNRLDMFRLLGGEDKDNVPSFLRNGTAIDPNSFSVKSLELVGLDLDKILGYIDAAGGATAQTNSFILKDIDPSIDLGITNTIGGVYDGNTKVVFGLDDVSKTPFFQLEREITPGERLVDGIVPRKASPVTFKNRFYFERMGPRQSMAIYNSNGELITNRGEKSLFQTTQPNYFTRQTQYFPSTQQPLTRTDATFGRKLRDYLIFPRPYYPAGAIQEQKFPTLGYTAPGQGQDGFNPASLTADEILKDWQYQKNYNRRLGYKALGYPLGATALGYGIYKSIYPDPCPCANGTMKVECCKEEDRTSQTIGTSNELRDVDSSVVNKTVIPDSIKRLQDNPNTRLENITDREYYEMMKKLRLRPDSINPKVPYRINVEDIPSEGEKYGGPTKSQFIKKAGGLLRKDEGGESTLGKGSRQDTLTSDVSKIKSDFIKKINKKAGDALLANVYKKANKTGDQGLINTLMGNQGVAQAKKGLFVDNDDLPDWYTGYNSMLKPRQYRKYFNRLKKLLPRGLDISRLNYANSIYNSNLSRAPFGDVFTIDDYAKLLTSAAYPMATGMNMQGPSIYVEDTDIFGRPKRYMVDFSGRMSAQRQAEQVEETNNKKNASAFGLPIILQNPGYDGIMPPSQTGIDFSNDKSVFLDWSQTPIQPQGVPGPEAYYEEGGFVDMEAENPLTRFVYGGDPCPEGSYWDDDLGECVPYAEGVPTREQLFTNPEDLDLLNKLNYKRNVQNYKRFRLDKVNEYIKQNYKGPEDKYDEEKHQSIPEWIDFYESEEYKKFLENLPDPEEYEENFTFPSDYPQKNYYPEKGDWDERSKQEYNKLFNPEMQKEDFYYQEKLKKEKYINEHWELRQKLDDLRKQEKWDELEKLNDQIYELIQEEEKNSEPSIDDIRKQRYNHWCPCYKMQEILVQGQPVQQKICVPCEQAKTGGYVNRNSKNSFNRFIYGGDEYTDFYEPYSLPEAGNGDAGSGQKCPPGYGYSKSQKKCVPFKPKRSYVPVTIPNRRDFGFRNMIPWNPVFSNAGSWSKQMSLPYYLGSGNPYMGQITGAPAARYVTKKGMFGKPKKWIDIYDVGAADDVLSNYDYVGPENMNSYDNNNMQQTRQKGPGRRDMLQQYAQNQYGFTNDEWQNETGDSRRDMMRSVRQDMRDDRRQERRDSRERMFPRMRAIDADRNPTGRGGQGLRNVLSRSLPFGAFLQPKEYGGDLNEYGPGGVNDPNTNPQAWMSGPGLKQYGTYDGNMVSEAPMGITKGFDASGNPVSQAPDQYNLNSKAYGKEPPKGSLPENYYVKDKNPIKRNLVGVENKRKNMLGIGPQEGILGGNSGALFVKNVGESIGRKQNEINLTLDNLSTNRLYPSATEIYQGKDVDYGSGIGMFTPGQGSDRSSFSTYGKYGGYMAYGGFADPYYEEDEEVIMTPEELEQFLAAGGQVEYL